MNWERVKDLLRLTDGRLWMLILAAAALVFTIQAVEAAVDGVWPHQRRIIRLGPGGRTSHAVWTVVALLLLPGLLLGVLNLAILFWWNVERSESQVIGGLLVGLVWLIFIVVSVDVPRLGRYLRRVGTVGPAAMLAILVVGDILLLIALVETLPPLAALRQLVNRPF